jgi:hypothetical protein
MSHDRRANTVSVLTSPSPAPVASAERPSLPRRYEHLISCPSAPKPVYDQFRSFSLSGKTNPPQTSSAPRLTWWSRPRPVALPQPSEGGRRLAFYVRGPRASAL